jgi:hypothetical protein
MSWRPRIFPAFLLAILPLVGGAWTQGRYVPPESGPQLSPTDKLDRQQQGFDGSKGRDRQPNSKDRGKKAARVTEIKSTAMSAGPRVGLAPGRYGKSSVRNQGPQSDANGSCLIGRGFNQSGSYGSTSFWDGYLLRSLQGEGAARKKAGSEDRAKDVWPPRGRTSRQFQ